MDKGPNTVTGNVSRSHHPCAVCRALVEACPHWLPSLHIEAGGRRALTGRPPRPNARNERAAAARAKRDVADFLRSIGVTS